MAQQTLHAFRAEAMARMRHHPYGYSCQTRVSSHGILEDNRILLARVLKNGHALQTKGKGHGEGDLGDKTPKCKHEP